MKGATILLFLSLSANADLTGCDPAELERQCFSSLCSPERGIATTPEAIAEELRRTGESVPVGTSEEFAVFRNNVTRAEAIVNSPLTDSEVQEAAAAFAISPTATEDFESLVRDVVTPDPNSDEAFVNPAVTEEEFPVQDTLELLLPLKRNMENGINYNNALRDKWGWSGGLGRELETFFRQVRLFYQETDPTKIPLLDQFLQLGGTGAQYPTEVVNGLDFRTAARAINARIFSEHQALVARIIRAQVRRAQTVSTRERLDSYLRSCQVAQYLQNRGHEASSPGKLRAHVAELLRLTEEKFFPRLSAHSSALIRRALTPDRFRIDSPEQRFRTSPVFREAERGHGGRVNAVIALLRMSTDGCELGSLVTDRVDYDPDSATGERLVYISPLTLGQGGLGVIAHELGHYISDLFGSPDMSTESKRAFTELRSCLSSMHPTETRGSEKVTTHEGDLYRTEEDFGDWFAATIGAPTETLGCDLQRLSSPRAGESSFRSREEDTHSNTLFRQLHLNAVSGKSLPQSCRELISITPEEQPRACTLPQANASAISSQ